MREQSTWPASTEKLKAKMEPPKQMRLNNDPSNPLTDRDRIRVHAQLKHEKIKAEATDILIDALHLQMSGGAMVSFYHNLAGKIEKLIIGDMPRAKLLAQVRTGIYTVILSRGFERHAAAEALDQ
jgi:hypothetical protein